MIEKASTAHSASSGDPTLDRRYGWAEAAFKERDAQACVEILDQTLAQAYHFTAAWHLYGLAQEALGHKEEAATAWRQCLTLDPNDHFGARLDLARIGAMAAEDATSENFSGTLFDGYADRFDSHLTQALHYNAPEQIKATLARFCENAGRAFRFDTVFDLGCGTGLMGEAIRDEAAFLAGCDVSPRMIERARAKTTARGGPLYDKLAVAGLTAFLASRSDASADLLLAADVFVYLGDLRPAFAQAARVLTRDGLLVFTVQSHDGEGVVVGQDRRFAHAEAWLRQRLDEAGLAIIALDPVSTRQDRGEAVAGFLATVRRAAPVPLRPSKAEGNNSPAQGI
ncbi:MAG: methyltransferase domain-containing protein [Bosea sp. (in: a-proteobacteria)]|uniref:class I SAM-dependent DNA methyltransferase n=1 Tax=Bosea sp. (in: a-proteobacteria) TaxID=1871050 RepID=UPI002736A21D|nr:methyltransferase [Bosea sp. (in: a-proteobacteria)]MDP3258025.1 methyltransferase domain-containing protein [Bosea sp. (in: a-proteobacteria)]MDP3318217.1 methyltransferase domain-containing protein [Bosea sp. (in: a-proteobacteria)]